MSCAINMNQHLIACVKSKKDKLKWFYANVALSGTIRNASILIPTQLTKNLFATTAKCFTSSSERQSRR